MALWLLFFACADGDDLCEKGNQDAIEDGTADGQSCAKYDLRPRRSNLSYGECYEASYDATYNDEYAAHCK
jgi:hypothetical protein